MYAAQNLNEKYTLQISFYGCMVIPNENWHDKTGALLLVEVSPI